LKLGKKMTVKAVNEKKLSIYQKVLFALHWFFPRFRFDARVQALEELPQCEELIVGNLRVFFAMWPSSCLFASVGLRPHYGARCCGRHVGEGDCR
jgi:hypothetical protein